MTHLTALPVHAYTKPSIPRGILVAPSLSLIPALQPSPQLGQPKYFGLCLSDLPTHQLCPQQFSADQFLPKSAFLPVPTGSIPICSRLWIMSAMWRDPGVVHLRQGYCWAEVIKILTAGIAVHPTHLHQKQLIWIIYILREEYLSFQTLEELQGGLGRRLNELICIN